METPSKPGWNLPSASLDQRQTLSHPGNATARMVDMLPGINVLRSATGTPGADADRGKNSTLR